MKQIISALFFVFYALLSSCSSDNEVSDSHQLGKSMAGFTTDPRGKLIIHNYTGLPVNLVISCFAFDSALDEIDYNKVLTGEVSIPSGITVTYDNFADVSNSTFAINTWLLTDYGVPSGTNISAQDANDYWAEAYDPMDPNDSKFAHWRNIRMDIEPSSSFDPTPFGGPPPAAAYGSGTTPYMGLAIELPEYVNQDSNQNIYSRRLPTGFYWVATLPGIPIVAYWHVIADSSILSTGDTEVTIYSIINGTP